MEKTKEKIRSSAGYSRREITNKELGETMLVSLNWIRDYLELEEWPDAHTFADRMIMSGSNIETVQETGRGMENVKIGKILSIENHPHADRLIVCQVDIGTEVLQIVTSAANVREGVFVPVAVDGSRVPGPLHGQPKQAGGVEIHAGSLRGVESAGMMCGPQELGIGDKAAPLDSKDGIWLLPGDWEEHLGENIDEALGLPDTVIDFEITPNRPDCLSMIGMAREAAATFGGKLIYPRTAKTDISAQGEQAKDLISVDVKSELCKRYTARIIRDVKIGPSPWWLQKRLIAAGMRPINNIVDITNFVMTEYGQPLHAFDIRSIAGGHIVVDTAKPGEVFTTLDGTERKLDETMLLIRDAEKPVAVAGVMGGLNSEILSDTNTVVIESANFDGGSVRKTSKKLVLRTEASSRYEKGIDPNLCEAAADRVCKLVELLGCGTVLPGSVDIYPAPERAKTVKARVSRINKVLGTDISRETMVGFLESLEMKVEGSGDEMLVTPPTVRQDLPEEVDFVEEVARMYGYNNLPQTLPSLQTVVNNTESWTLRNTLRTLLCGMGASEIETFSFISDKELDACRIPEDAAERDTVKIINPMGEDTAALRTVLMPRMLEVLARNASRGTDAVRAFEIGTVFDKSIFGEDKLPMESYNLCLGIYGENEDFFTLKGMLEALFAKLGITHVSYRAEEEYGTYHPGRCARIVKTTDEGEEVELGIMGEIHPDVAAAYQMEVRIYGAELFFVTLQEFRDPVIRYRGLPKYPAMVRDIALVVPEERTAQEVEDVIRAAAGELLKDLKLFDVYRGEQVGAGSKSLAYSLTYRHEEKTLTDEETAAVHGKVLDALREKAGAQIRDN